MGELVHIDSIDALRKFRTALCKSAESIMSGLDEADADVRRTASWLEHDQQRHWKQEVRRRSELYSRAKSALSQKKMDKSPLGERRSCVDEEKALAAAERRLEEARRKLANVQRWRRMLDEEYFSCQAAAHGLAQMVEVDVPVALARLDEMVDALEAYAVSATPKEQTSVARGPEEEQHGAPSEVEDHRRLRERTPSLEVLDRAPAWAAEELSWLPICTNAADRSALEALALTPMPIAPVDRVIVSAGVRAAGRVYWLRVETPDGGDWYVGVVGEPAGSVEASAPLGELLALRPELEPLVMLPVGTLVILADASLEAVLDARDALLWRVEAAGRPAEAGA